MEAVLDLLKLHSIRLLVDVRQWPTSKRFPQFRRGAFADSLANDGIDYTWRGDLGGYRTTSPDSPNNGWRTGTFRGYADFMMTPAFDEIMLELTRLAGDKRMAVMCAEAMPWRCHRQLLADAFVVRGLSVRHIFEDRCEEHQLPPFAKPTGTRILYPAP